MFQKKSNIGFADIAVSKRNIKVSFLEKMKTLIEWQELESIINQNYNRGKRFDGRPAYNGLLLMKISLLKEWYGVSMLRIEQMINDSVSLSHFLELSLDDKIPSSSTVSNFIKEMKKKGVYKQLTGIIEEKIKESGLAVKKGYFRPPVLVKRII